MSLSAYLEGNPYTITFETNSETESWGDAFRIKCLRSDAQTPDAFINAMRTARRINCNDYVQNLYEYHDFDFDVGNKVLIGNYNKVKQTVPASYHFDFADGIIDYGCWDSGCGKCLYKSRGCGECAGVAFYNRQCIAKRAFNSQAC